MVAGIRGRWIPLSTSIVHSFRPRPLPRPRTAAHSLPCTGTAFTRPCARAQPRTKPLAALGPPSARHPEGFSNVATLLPSVCCVRWYAVPRCAMQPGPPCAVRPTSYSSTVRNQTSSSTVCNQTYSGTVCMQPSACIAVGHTSNAKPSRHVTSRHASHDKILVPASTRLTRKHSRRARVHGAFRRVQDWPGAFLCAWLVAWRATR